MGGAAVEGDRLHRPMRAREDGAAGRLVDATALHADEVVLDEVEEADAVVAAQLVEAGEPRGRRPRPAAEPHGHATPDINGDAPPRVGALPGPTYRREDAIPRTRTTNPPP